MNFSKITLALVFLLAGNTLITSNAYAGDRGVMCCSKSDPDWGDPCVFSYFNSVLGLENEHQATVEFSYNNKQYKITADETDKQRRAIITKITQGNNTSIFSASYDGDYDVVSVDDDIECYTAD